MGFISSDAHLLIPKMVAGQTVTFTVRANKNTINVNPDLDTQSLVELVSETNVVGTSYTTVTYRVRYNVTLPTHMGFTMGGGFLQIQKEGKGTRRRQGRRSAKRQFAGVLRAARKTYY